MGGPESGEKGLGVALANSLAGPPPLGGGSALPEALMQKSVSSGGADPPSGGVTDLRKKPDLEVNTNGCLHFESADHS